MFLNSLSNGVTGHTMQMRRVPVRFCFAALVMAGLLLSGCEPHVALRGVVTDTSGQPLPGVSVKVAGTETFAITNGTGAFGRGSGRLPVLPGTWQLQYIKTGFTSAEQIITTANGRSQEVPTIALWPLPAARGIYNHGDDSFQGWTRIEPERYLREDRSPVVGTRQRPLLIVDNTLGRIIGYKVSPYDWRMSRLEETPVLRDVEATGEAAKALDMVWAESVGVPVHAVPLDEPERLLWEIKPGRAVGPGIYAIHWGALDGDPSTEASVYLIEVRDPAAVVEAEVETEKKEEAVKETVTAAEAAEGEET